MEIEVVTTKKKLTKSIVNQMYFASKKDVLTGTGLGRLVNVRKKNSVVILIRVPEGKYRLINRDYRKRENLESVDRPLRGLITFESKEKCQEWWEHYQRILSEGSEQIYI